MNATAPRSLLRAMAEQNSGRSPFPGHRSYTYASLSAALLSPPHLNSVQFVFPRDGDRELWCDGDILAAASPYFRILLQPGFEEGELKKVKTQKPRRARQPLPFDDSDDDEALARTPPTPPPSRYSDYPHRRVEIYEASYTTYRAVLCWILTRHISFAPLHSTFDAEAPEERRAERTLTLETRTLASPKLPTPASPKSVYRLAHLLEMPELEELALASFARQLSAATFAQELFPEITGTYEKILDKIIDFIVETQDDLKDLYDWEELASIIGSIEGEPWGGEVVARAFAAFV